jgi:hypothetical protein
MRCAAISTATAVIWLPPISTPIAMFCNAEFMLVSSGSGFEAMKISIFSQIVQKRFAYYSEKIGAVLEMS